MTDSKEPADHQRRMGMLGRLMQSICLLLLLVLSSQSFAETSLWRVSKGDRELFLGGTIHVLSKKDYPLPEEFGRAYTRSQKLVFETDMEALKGASFQQQVMRLMTYSDGRSLRDALNRETYQTLKTYTGSRGIPIAIFDRFKPSMVVLTLTTLELQRLGITSLGVDDFFYQRARGDNKEIGKLETVKEQLHFLAEMGKGLENELVRNTIEEMSQLGSMLEDMTSAWRKGDQRKLAVMALTPLRDGYPDLYKRLLTDRNDAWMPPIKAFLKTLEVELILVGALHLIGDEGLLEQLRGEGYKVEPF